MRSSAPRPNPSKREDREKKKRKKALENHPHIVSPAATQHTYTIIFLYGKDSDAPEFAAELFESQASDDRTFSEIFPSFKWVFPQSKTRIASRFESEESQWFEIWYLENPLER